MGVKLYLPGDTVNNSSQGSRRSSLVSEQDSFQIYVRHFIADFTCSVGVKQKNPEIPFCSSNPGYPVRSQPC
jgi:hypothetical protein